MYPGLVHLVMVVFLSRATYHLGAELWFSAALTNLPSYLRAMPDETG
jgi:hypothetical protein